MKGWVFFCSTAFMALVTAQAQALVMFTDAEAEIIALARAGRGEKENARDPVCPRNPSKQRWETSLFADVTAAEDFSLSSLDFDGSKQGTLTLDNRTFSFPETPRHLPLLPGVRLLKLQPRFARFVVRGEEETYMVCLYPGQSWDAKTETVSLPEKAEPSAP